MPHLAALPLRLRRCTEENVLVTPVFAERGGRRRPEEQGTPGTKVSGHPAPRHVRSFRLRRPRFLTPRTVTVELLKVLSTFPVSQPPAVPAQGRRGR